MKCEKGTGNHPNEKEALNYIEINKRDFLDALHNNQVITVFTNENTRINVMGSGVRLLKFINRFEGNRKLVEIYKDMIDLKLV